MKLQKVPPFWVKYCLSLGVLTWMGLGAAIAPQSAQAQNRFIDGGRTTQNSYVRNVPGTPDYQISPLLTVGGSDSLLVTCDL